MRFPQTTTVLTKQKLHADSAAFFLLFVLVFSTPFFSVWLFSLRALLSTRVLQQFRIYICGWYLDVSNDGTSDKAVLDRPLQSTCAAFDKP